MITVEKDVLVPAKNVRQKYYIAVDGAEFKFEDDCKRHEVLLEYSERIKDTPHKKVGVLDSFETADAYYIKNQEEYNTIIAYHEYAQGWRINNSLRNQFKNEDWYLFRKDDIS